ncbi:MAG: multidrug efflux RND transporter permease subunit [Planctomycetes bacterium]|nr:multidrug efflux RND transporter permease subunit [Planctomycetota bacterium]
MLSHFFIARPIFAMVLSIVITIVGVVSMVQLPIAQYPDVAPPTVTVTATYPGANASTVAATVALPIEQEINGVERMLYMTSRSTNDGVVTIDVVFELGTNLDMAQVFVQNRVAIAEPKLPEEVKKLGVTTKKKSPSILLMVNVLSPDDRYDQIYLSNFATLNVKDDLARIRGMGEVKMMGGRDYSMRVWLDPRKMAARGLVIADVVRALQEQNVQVAAGRLGQPPVPAGVELAFQLPLTTQGRLERVEQFADVVVKAGADRQIVYLRDLVRDEQTDARGDVTTPGIELGAKDYELNSYLGDKPCISLACFQMPGSNALDVAEQVRAKMEELKPRFPDGVEYRIVYDTTVFVEESIVGVVHTLFEAFVLVFLVTLIFLQDWRTTIVPMVAVPVSLVGTFAGMAMFGFSLNNLSMFGLVLAIGIVVDDAIVVVENVERLMKEGLSPVEAAKKAMTEVSGAIVAITLVIMAVFVPTAFMAGISGEFYKQFALTIACSVAISGFNSLTLSPALCALLFKAHDAGGHGGAGHGHAAPEALRRLGVLILGGLAAWALLPGHAVAWLGLAEKPFWLGPACFAAGAAGGWFVARGLNWLLAGFFRGFNWAFDRVIAAYGKVVAVALRVSVLMLLVYGGLLFATGFMFQVVPGGFVPAQDKGYFIVNVQLPQGAALERTDAVVREIRELAESVPGVAHTISMPGYSALLATNLSNTGALWVVLSPFEERAGRPDLAGTAIFQALRQKFAPLQSAEINVFGAPPVDGIGSTGGFKIQVQDRRSAGLSTLAGGVEELSAAATADDRIAFTFSSFSVAQPQLRVDIDREKAKAQRVSLDDVNRALQGYLGAFYVNDFTFLDRNWQVNLQADPRQRLFVEDIGRLEVRNADGQRVPLATLVNVRESSGPPVVSHYNLYPSAELNGVAAPGVSSAQSIAAMDQLAKDTLPDVLGTEWTELSLQENLAAADLMTKLVFPLAILFVFLVLAAQYESWSLPLSILLIVPLCILASLFGVHLVGLDNNIFVQIGLVVLVSLAAKNAILIVEFAKQLQDQGKSRRDATIEACRLRLRPILMTSFAFILGVVPLVLAKGAGAEMRQTLGVAVFSGMLGVTVFGLVLTPVFYSVIRWFGERGKPAPAAGAAAGTDALPP